MATKTAGGERPRANRSCMDGILSFLGILAALSLALAAWVYGFDRPENRPTAPEPAPTYEPTPTELIDLPPFDDFSVPLTGLARAVRLHTTLPDFSGYAIKQYEVQKGDTLFGIADKFKIKPQTILWGNYDVLYDQPDRLSIGTPLRILPVDGALYRWSKDDGLNGVSSYFKVTPEEIIHWPGNGLSEETIGDYAHPNIAVGTLLVIPGGKREFISFSVPAISRSDPANAKVLGPGYCGTITSGLSGGGTFVWPTSSTDISGYTFDPSINHFGLDFGGAVGNPIYATDSGVVVYSGWNDWGYGNLIIIDHGNGWQSLYAHLAALFVGCGDSISQGAQIGTIGLTGNTTGPHLHFELSIGGTRVNPLGYLQ